MARKNVLLNSEFPYHVTARCINKQWFDLPIQDVWTLMENYLFLSQKMYSLRIHAFVLMPNHFHLTVSTPEANISRAMQFFMGQTSQEITRLSGRINQTYGRRHHKSLISKWHYALNVYKYVYRNPVKAGLAGRAEDYPFSTLYYLCGKGRSIIPMIEDVSLFENPDSTLKWINTRPLRRHEEEIKTGLTKTTFQLPLNRQNKKPSDLETLLI